MKNQTWVSTACSLLLVFASLSNDSAFADTSIKDGKKKLVGEWQVGFHPRMFSPGAKVSFRQYFLTGQVGPVWRFNDDGTATAFIPCDISEKFRKGDIANGTWQLLEEGKILSLRAHSLVRPNSPMEMRGALEVICIRPTRLEMGPCLCMIRAGVASLADTTVNSIRVRKSIE